MSEQTEYEAAYKALHGKPPKIRKNGSWILIGDGPDWMALKCRKSDLPAMTRQLIWRARRKAEHEKMVEKCGDAIGGFDPDQRSI